MTDNNPFLTTEQEIARAANEVALMKEAVKDMLAKLSLIEKRLAATAPVAVKGKKANATSVHKQPPAAGQEEVFNNLLAHYKTNAQATEAEINKWKNNELTALAKYTGSPVKSGAKKKDLVAIVLGRLRESKIMGGGIG